jgi:hypothetical protein
MPRRERTNWREADARRALAQIERAGEADAAYERRTGVPTSRLRWWRKRLARTVADGRETSVAMHLLPVRVREGTGARAAPGTEEAATFDVVVGGHLVRVPAGFDEDSLVRLVRALERAAC